MDNKQSLPFKKSFLVACLCLFCSQIFSQVVAPGAQLQELDKRNAEQTAPNEAVVAKPAGETVQFLGFKFSGLDQDQLAKIGDVWKPKVGEQLSFQEINSLLDLAQRVLQKQGDSIVLILLSGHSKSLLNVKAVPVNYAGVVLKNEGALSDSYVTSVLNYDIDGNKINSSQLERNAQILSETPGARLAYGMVPGKNAGDTELQVQLEQTPVFQGFAEEANTGVKQMGMWQTFVGGSLSNALGQGEQIALTGMAASNSYFVAGSADMPIGYSGLRGGITGSYFNYSYMQGVGDQFTGNASSSGLYLTYPLARTPTHKSNLKAEYLWKTNNGNFDPAGPAPIMGLSDLPETIFNLTYSGANALSSIDTVSYSVTGSAGNVKQGIASAAAQDYYGPQQLGQFAKLAGSGSWEHFLGKDSVQFTAQFQISNKNLSSGDKMYWGGMNNFSGYQTQTIGVDQGSSIKAQYNFRTQASDIPLQISPFAEYGAGVINHNNYQSVNYLGAVLKSANGNNVRMADAGIAVQAQVAKNTTISGSVAARLMPIPTPFNLPTHTPSAVQGFVKLGYQL